jgi:hypothetical protein
MEDSGTIMIRIIVGAPAASGFIPYRIDGHWGPDGAPLIGIAENPVAEACRVLAALGVDLGTRVRVEASQTRLGPIHATGLLRHLGDVKMLPQPPKALTTSLKTWSLRFGAAPKALPPPRRARRKALVARGSGVPGDG